MLVGVSALRRYEKWGRVAKGFGNLLLYAVAFVWDRYTPSNLDDPRY